MDRRVVKLLNEMPEYSRFVRGLRGWVGFRQTGVEYDRQERAAGKSKYNLARLCKLAVDGLIGFSSVPLRLATWQGVAASALGFSLLVWAIATALLKRSTPSGWASLAVMILFFGGIQLLMLGIIGEYIGRIFDEVKQRPNFIISTMSGWLGPTKQPNDASVAQTIDAQTHQIKQLLSRKWRLHGLESD